MSILLTNLVYILYMKITKGVKDNMEYTIANEFTLPSEGKVYNQEVNPQFKLRSMTTMEEMKRLNHSERPYAMLAEIIDDCLVEGIGISAYDLCLADFQYVLHKLRIVTYGPKYNITSTCPYCASANQSTINLDDLSLMPFDKELLDKYMEFQLPVTGNKIRLRLQTPRIVDDVTVKAKDYRRKNPKAVGEPAYLFTLESLIGEIDGVRPEQFRILPFVQKLPMGDSNYILKSAQKLTETFGLDKMVLHQCPVCGLDYTSNFRTNSEFFGPSID